jgi:hypothetical protein
MSFTKALEIKDLVNTTLMLKINKVKSCELERKKERKPYGKLHVRFLER